MPEYPPPSRITINDIVLDEKDIADAMGALTISARISQPNGAIMILVFAADGVTKLAELEIARMSTMPPPAPRELVMDQASADRIMQCSNWPHDLVLAWATICDICGYPGYERKG